MGKPKGTLLVAKGTSLTLDTWWDVYKFYDTDRPLYMPKYK